jgi:hypothetical protein
MKIMMRSKVKIQRSNFQVHLLSLPQTYIEGQSPDASGLRNLTLGCNNGCGCDQEAFYPVLARTARTTSAPVTPDVVSRRRGETGKRWVFCQVHVAEGIQRGSKTRAL